MSGIDSGVFAAQSPAMQNDWAVENLQVIRTLMERSAVYRRALAPIMIALGATGLAAGFAGKQYVVGSPREFVLFWMGIGVLSVIEAFLLIRRQSIRAQEPYWSPPTRRVTQAALPALFAGIAAGLPFVLMSAGRLPIYLLPPAWVALYGCALHSAGFFMPRGVKVFGWLFLVGGCLMGLGNLASWPAPSLAACNRMMVFWFGWAHLAYGIYLAVTEKRRAAQ